MADPHGTPAFIEPRHIWTLSHLEYRPVRPPSKVAFAQPPIIFIVKETGVATKMQTTEGAPFVLRKGAVMIAKPGRGHGNYEAEAHIEFGG